MSDEFLDLAGVLGCLRRSRSWFYANRRRLEADGFPKPHSITGRWDGLAVNAWRAAGRKQSEAVRQHVAGNPLKRAMAL